MATRLFLLLFVCLAASGCAETGHFLAEPDPSLADAEVVLTNESDRVVVLELVDAAKQKQKLEVGAKSDGRAPLSAGVYSYQLLVSSHDPWDKKWFSHGPKGRLEASAGERYSWTFAVVD